MKTLQWTMGLMLYLLLFPELASAIGFCNGGPYTQTVTFQRDGLSVRVPQDDAGQHVLVIQQDSTYTGCTSLGLLPSVSSTINSSFGNGGNSTAPAAAGLPAGFSGISARRFQVNGNIYIQNFFEIISSSSSVYCGLTGGLCDLSLIGLQIGSSVTFRTYTVLVVDGINSLIGTTQSVSSSLGRLTVTQGLLGSIYVDVNAGLNYVFDRASCDLVDVSQVINLPTVGSTDITTGGFAGSTDFDIRLNNCVVPRSLSISTSTFAGSLIRMTFLPSSGQLASGSGTDLLPADAGQPGVAGGVAFQIRQRASNAPVVLDGATEITAPFGGRDPADTTEIFQFKVGLVPVAGETVVPGLLSGAVTFEVEYR
ncbi:fimbrial protein [Alloalcanivorax xenomutans]|nr:MULTISPECIES: fimbrial protein [Alcanivoracaceae]SOC09886.1 type 1 fimbria pilin [Alloalcanivorax xenomutans]